jgi:hypothetical protein
MNWCCGYVLLVLSLFNYSEARMAKWSKLWNLPKGEREAALKAARFTPEQPGKKAGGGYPSNQPAPKKG